MAVLLIMCGLVLAMSMDLPMADAGNMMPGSTFVRWGRKLCANSGQLVYSGVAGGSEHSHKGGAANSLCLTLTPEMTDEAKPAVSTYLYGGEYESVTGHIDQDMPCAVCRVPQSTTIMMPATRSCPKGWTLQYSGYLIAGHHTHPAASEFLCQDQNPEFARNGQNNKQGRLYYHVLTQCGSLPCPPYRHDKVVYCAVCSM